MRYTAEHAYGYAVRLWQDGNSLAGLLLVSQGLQGDTPAGTLENVKFDSATGALSFTAKLSLGVSLLPDGRQEPSRDLFEFSGTLGDSLLSGTFTRSDPRRPRRQSTERVQLRKGEEAPPAAMSYSGWKRETESILERRGPRW